MLDLGHIVRAETAEEDHQGGLVLSLVPKDRRLALLDHVFDEEEFLSDFGIRSLSRYHLEHPYTLKLNGMNYEVRYLPAEGDSALFGGNSNWRGPVWVPMNKLLRAALAKYGIAYGAELTIEHPRGSGRQKTFAEVVEDLDQRMLSLLRMNEAGIRPVHGK